MPKKSNPAQQKLAYLSVSQLRFDPHNPRFAKTLSLGSDQAIIERMYEDENIAELVISISEQGFFPGEPLLVFPSENADDKFIVAEGNRRLAALKLLTRELRSPSSGLTSLVENIPSKIQDSFNPVPCIIFKNRGEILHYLGYRHITGVRAWGPLEKALFLKQLKDDLQQKGTFEDDESLHHHLAREIGSKPKFVGLSLATLTFYQKALKKNGRFFENQQLTEDDINFGVLYTALSYPTIATFVGMDSNQDNIQSNLNEPNAQRLLEWLFQKKDRKTILRDSRNLGKLAHIVANPQAVETLVKLEDIDEAFDMTNGPEQAFDIQIEKLETAIGQISSLLKKSTFQPHKSQIQALQECSIDLENLYRKAKIISED